MIIRESQSIYLVWGVNPLKNNLERKAPRKMRGAFSFVCPLTLALSPMGRGNLTNLPDILNLLMVVFQFFHSFCELTPMPPLLKREEGEGIACPVELVLLVHLVLLVVIFIFSSLLR
jgi:hypothetical protein